MPSDDGCIWTRKPRRNVSAPDCNREHPKLLTPQRGLGLWLSRKARASVAFFCVNEAHRFFFSEAAVLHSKRSAGLDNGKSMRCLCKAAEVSGGVDYCAGRLERGLEDGSCTSRGNVCASGERVGVKGGGSVYIILGGVTLLGKMMRGCNAAIRMKGSGTGGRRERTRDTQYSPMHWGTAFTHELATSIGGARPTGRT